jgi:hypothetical protein
MRVFIGSIGGKSPMEIKNLLKKASNKSSFLYDATVLLLFILMGILGRTILVGWNIQPFPNFEIIMVLTFLAAFMVRPTVAFLIPLVSMIGSDLLLGNPIFIGSQMNKIILFTYSGFLLVGIMNIAARSKLQPRIAQFKIQTIGIVAGAGIIFTLFYDVWTNIGWWYLMYPHTSSTFASVFLAGIPFMMYHLLSATITFILVGIPVLYFAQNKRVLSLPKKQTSLHYLPVVAITVLFIGLSFLGSAMIVPERTDIWLEQSDATSVTINIHGDGWTLTDSICVTEKTTVLSLLQEVSTLHSLDLRTTYYESFDATLVDSIGGDVNGQNDYYWQYYVNGELPISGCDEYPVSNGDVIEWDFRVVSIDI